MAPGRIVLAPNAPQHILAPDSVTEKKKRGEAVLMQGFYLQEVGFYLPPPIFLDEKISYSIVLLVGGVQRALVAKSKASLNM